MRTCTSCKKEKKLTEFWDCKRSKSGLQSWCKSCKRIGSQDYKDRNRDVLYEARRDKYAANPQPERDANQKRRKKDRKKTKRQNIIGHQKRRAEANGVKFDLDESHLVFMLEFFSHSCGYCGVDVMRGYTIDHIFPISRGGGTVIENLIPACRSCNSKKGNKTPCDFLMLFSDVDADRIWNRIIEYQLNAIELVVGAFA